MKILLIEDDDMDAEAILRTLRQGPMEDLELVRSSRLSEGLRRLQEDPFDVLLLDLGLPDSQGLDTVNKVLALNTSAAVVVQTGFENDGAAMEAVAAGAQDYLIKSRINPDYLFRSIRYAHGRKQTENKLREVNGKLEDSLTSLVKMQAKVVQKERLSAIGQMTCGIAHDFNNALTPILGNVDYLLTHPDALEDKALAHRMLQMIKTSANDAAGVVRRLRKFYQPQTEDNLKEAVDMGMLLEEVVELTRPRWKVEARSRGCQIEVRKELEGPCVVTGDAGDLRELFFNLMSNSVDAIESEGRIEMTGRREGDWVEIRFADTGCGMPTEILDKCFEPFMSTKGQHGTGLGLATAYSTVERHKGDIQVKSEVGVGTEFVIRFPASMPAKEPPCEISAKPIKNSLRILVVDDEAPIRFLTEKILSKEGHRCTTASSGEEALELFEKEAFDLVITDRTMPKMTGDELAAEMLKTSPGTPVLMLTGYGEFMNTAHELPSGVQKVLSKPFDIATLRSVLTDIKGSDGCG